ncbi:MAG: ornithine cyclodeaminase family protein [Alphaproteobacteria bacterium]|jgi:ornithine cyclodeaminase|nr:ornithine cyclodeaminase family protein [Alphaproteobacteria bacterium]
MQLRILSENDVRSVLSMADAIDIQARGFAMLADGQSVEGLRSFARSDAPHGIAIFNPSFLKGGGGYGVKVVSDYFDNGDRGVPRMSALVALFDGATGQPRTVMEGGYLTDVRTGAGTALAARYLARKESRVVAVFGAGRVARNQLQALCVEHAIERVVVATRSEARGEAFIERMRTAGGGVPEDIRLVDDRTEAAAEADIVVCCTTSREPVFPGAALRSGAFVVGAGANLPEMREVDTETIRRAARHVIDSRRDCLKNAGDLLIAEKEGALDLESVAEIADLVAGRASGRQSDAEITFYESIGVPIQDLVTAQFVEERAADQGIGTLIDIGGDQD